MMSDQNSESTAQFVDKFLHRTALGTLLMTCAYAVSSAMYLVSEDVMATLDMVGLLLKLSAVVVILPVFIKRLRLRSRQQCNQSESDGYMAEVLKKACVKAFSFTFVFLVLLEPTTKKYLTELPTDFFINVILAFSLGVFSLTFFALIRSDDDEHEDGFNNEQQS